MLCENYKLIIPTFGICKGRESTDCSAGAMDDSQVTNVFRLPAFVPPAGCCACIK